jgi:hypothetical protein
MAFVYNNGIKLLTDNTGRINWLSDTIKAALVTTTYVADRDDTTASAFSGAELSGTGYVGGFGGAGRLVLAGKSLTTDNVNNRSTFGATNPVWAAINAGTAHAIVLLKEVTTDSDSLLIAYLDGVADQPTVGGQLTGSFPGGLCFYITT